IGLRLGRNVYDYYAYNSQHLRYFDARSPFTQLYYIQGSYGESIFEGEFSRNIKPWWNAGIAYKRITSNKQIGATQRQDRQVDHNGVKIYTHLQTNNNRYHLFANYLHNNHAILETGGVRPAPLDSTSDNYFQFLNETVNLNQATGRDVRHSFHVGQTYALFGETLKLFYNFDERRQLNRFDDNGLVIDVDTANGSRTVFFHPNKINYDSTQTHDRS